MATEIPVQKLSGNAAADLSGSQYLGVVIDANGDIDVAGAAARITGVLQNKPLADQVAEVMVKGESPAVYGANVTAGDELEIDAAGKFITLAAGIAVAIARESGAADEQHTVVLL